MISSPQRGYTLIELLISVAIFAIVMLGSTAAYISFINYNRQAQTTATIINSLYFAIDGMARDIRAGYTYSCSGGCTTSGNTQMSFIDSTGGCTVTYSVSGGAIVRSTSGGSCAAIQTNAPITDPSISISSLLFYVRGSTAHDAVQPMATIVVSGTATVPNSTTVIPFQIETGATQRLLDI